jgi:hypothetical protein
VSPVASRLLTWGVLGPSAVGLGALWWALTPTATVELNLLHYSLFVLAGVVTELMPMQQPGGRPVATSLAILATLALLGASPVGLTVVAALGWLVARALERKGLRLATLGMRMLGAWSLAGVVALGATAGLDWVGSTSHRGEVASLDVGAAAAVVLAIVVGSPLLQAIVRDAGRPGFSQRRLTEAVVGSWMVGAAISSTALLGGLVYDVLGAWTLPTMLIPLLAARMGMDRFAVAATAYDQTIRAMSRLPEQLDAIDDGHGVRVAGLAHQVGLELGLDADTLVGLEHAAHLHELGRIRLDDPEGDLTPVQLATAGASIIRETGSLDRVARIVEAHGEPHGAVGDTATPARIVAACCAVDRYGPAPGDEGQQQEMLVRLVRDIGDLEVVAALSRVLDRDAAGV